MTGADTKEEKIRQARANQVQPEVPHGVDIKVYTPTGLLRRRFPATGFYQDVYDWLGASRDLPLYFVLVHQGQNGSLVRLPDENVQPHGELLKLVERAEHEIKSIMNREEVTFRGTLPNTSP